MPESNRGDKRAATAVLARIVGVVVPAAVVVLALITAAAIKGWHLSGDSVEASEEAAPSDFCAEHGVPESLCTICNPGLKERLEWCGGHGLPEALCTVCNPELKESLETCTEHDLPPSFCQECSKERADAAGGDQHTDDAAAKSAVSDALKAPELCRDELPIVRLASAHVVHNAGLEVVAVGYRTLETHIICIGQAAYNQNRFATVRPRVEGIVHAVHVDVGRAVSKGDVMAVVDSAQLGEAKADYLAALAMLDLARKNHERLRRLADQQIVAGKAMLEAETRLQEAKINVNRARQRLLNLRLSPEEIDRFARDGDTSSLLPITAPRDGVVVRRSVAVGEAVLPTTELFAVADLSTMWVWLDLFEHDSRLVRVGQPVSFRVDSLPGEEFEGRITWISPEVNTQTRTIRVRAEIKNRGGLLRAGMYGVGVIQTDAPSQALVVPKTAVQWHERQPVVFVQKGDSLFEPRRIVLGRKAGPFWEVVEGLSPGTPVVTTGSFLLKTELMRGAIGAGCCE